MARIGKPYTVIPVRHPDIVDFKKVHKDHYRFVFGVHSISMNSCEKSYLNKHTSWLLFSQLNIFYFVPYNFIIFDVTCHIAVMVLMDFLEVNNIWMSNRESNVIPSDY
jgi:hypothetical protein